MYDTPITKRFKKTPYKAVKNVYSAATGKSLRTPKAVMLSELESYCSRVGMVARVVCYRALTFEESICLIIKDASHHESTKDTVKTWGDNAFALKEVLRHIRGFVQ